MAFNTRTYLVFVCGYWVPEGSAFIETPGSTSKREIEDIKSMQSRFNDRHIRHVSAAQPHDGQEHLMRLSNVFATDTGARNTLTNFLSKYTSRNARALENTTIQLFLQNPETLKSYLVTQYMSLECFLERVGQLDMMHHDAANDAGQ